MTAAPDSAASDSAASDSAVPDPAASESPASGPATPAPRESKPSLIFDDPLDQQSSDDTDRGWGERPGAEGGGAADLKRFLDEKPPHHI